MGRVEKRKRRKFLTFFGIFDSFWEDDNLYPSSVWALPSRFSFVQFCILEYYLDIVMNQTHYLTAEGLEKLKEELRFSKMVKRREIAAHIEAAKALGDLSENAEYHEAKEEMALLESRIFEIQEILQNVSVIEDEKGAFGIARVGSVIKVKVKGQEKTFTIVGSNEAEPVAGRISNESPIGSALLGAKKGDVVEVKSPSGMTVYEILEVK